MDVLKATDAALYVQNFFQGVQRSDWVGLKPIKSSKLPVWMNQVAQFYSFPVGKTNIALIAPNEGSEFEQVINLYRVFQSIEPIPVLVLADHLPSKSRGALVRMRIPHVVTNTAIFAPQLGVAYGKPKISIQNEEIKERLSPVGLKVLSRYLLKKDLMHKDFTLLELQKLLTKENYPLSLSTLSRLFTHLQALHLVSVKGGGKARRLQMKDREEVWSYLLTSEIETVLRRIRVGQTPPKSFGWVYSGDTALAKVSDLAEPNILTIAMATSDYREWIDQSSRKTADKSEESKFIIELWREDPTYLAEKECLNPIELSLSLRRDNDPRIQMAVSDLLNRYDLNFNLEDSNS